MPYTEADHDRALDRLARDIRQYTTISDDRIGCRCCESLPDTPCPAWCDYASAAGTPEQDARDAQAHPAAGERGVGP